MSLWGFRINVITVTSIFTYPDRPGGWGGGIQPPNLILYTVVGQAVVTKQANLISKLRDGNLRHVAYTHK